MGHIYVRGPSEKIYKKLFKRANINIAYKTKNTLGYMLTHKTHINTNSTGDKYHNSGIISINLIDCRKKYIGQTDRSFRTRFREHFNDSKHGKGYYKFCTAFTRK